MVGPRVATASKARPPAKFYLDPPLRINTSGVEIVVYHKEIYMYVHNLLLV